MCKWLDKLPSLLEMVRSAFITEEAAEAEGAGAMASITTPRRVTKIKAIDFTGFFRRF